MKTNYNWNFIFAKTTKYIKSFWNWIFNSNKQKETINEMVIDDNIKQGTIDESYDDDEIINHKIRKHTRISSAHKTYSLLKNIYFCS